MFRVIWTQRAGDQFRAMWRTADAAERERITELAIEIEHDLLVAADLVGESRAPPMRIGFQLPLAYHVWINEQPSEDGIRVATVVRVWLVKPHKR
jgi:hypothetical protein